MKIHHSLQIVYVREGMIFVPKYVYAIILP